MKISGLQKLSTIDYPKHLSAVVFTNGCNYNCWYCHNRQLIDGNAENMPIDEIFDFLIKRKKYLSGLVISGGEPTLQEDLYEFIQKVKTLGYLVKLDTNGSNPETLKKCLGVVDYVAIDYKAPERLYTKICGAVDYESVKESIMLLGANQVKWEIRTTLVPELIPHAEIIKAEIEAFYLPNKYEIYRYNEYKKHKET